MFIKKYLEKELSKRKYWLYDHVAMFFLDLESEIDQILSKYTYLKYS